MFWKKKEVAPELIHKASTILKNPYAKKIVLSFPVQNVKKRVNVQLRFIENSICCFSLSKAILKPRNHSEVYINVYMNNCVYRAVAKITEILQSYPQVFISTEIPETWTKIQQRKSPRIEAKLPMTVEYKDGKKFSATTKDISIGGISFLLEDPIPDVYKQFTATVTVKLPEDVLLNFKKGELICEAQYQREKDLDKFGFGLYGSVHVYKFISIDADDKAVLQNYIMKNIETLNII